MNATDLKQRELPTYGGQAVIEGVMMRGRRAAAIAMRDPDGEIVVHEERLGAIYQSRLSKIPFLRGLVVLWDALGLGVRALTISANVQTGEDEKVEGPGLYLTLFLSLALAVGLFILTPAAAGQVALSRLGWAPWLANLGEGVVRLVILVGYISAISLMPDVRRVYAYHGAEHKTINAFESGDELTPARVARHSREHPRCGTAFLLTVVIFSILLFSLLGPLPLLWRLGGRILLLPVLAGLAYEYIRWTATHLGNPVVAALVRPNLALQRLTTREPDERMLEVAIRAFQTMRDAENEPELVTA